MLDIFKYLAIFDGILIIASSSSLRLSKLDVTQFDKHGVTLNKLLLKSENRRNLIMYSYKA